MTNAEAFIEMAKGMHFHSLKVRTNYPFGINRRQYKKTHRKSGGITSACCKTCGVLVFKQKEEKNERR